MIKHADAQRMQSTRSRVQQIPDGAKITVTIPNPKPRSKKPDEVFHFFATVSDLKHFVATASDELEGNQRYINELKWSVSDWTGRATDLEKNLKTAIEGLKLIRDNAEGLVKAYIEEILRRLQTD